MQKPECQGGRWTNLIEIGPWVTFTPEAWTAVWRRLVPFLQTGYGLDNTWCSFVAEELGKRGDRTCLVGKLPQDLARPLARIDGRPSAPCMPTLPFHVLSTGAYLQS